ncbi:MAG TPA: hypothetical protein VIV06_00630 [Candidatus Limnocylindrales bacterium]
MADRPLYPVNRRHLDALTGPLGIWQHASGTVPDEAFGYCTDDVARALLVDLLHRRELGWDAVAASARRSLRFLRDAFDPAIGRFRNFRDRGGSWLEVVGSEDSQGRAVLALGAAAGTAPDDDFVAEAASLFADALPAVAHLTALRATASALLGCGHALDAGLRDGAERTFEVLASRLARAFVAVEHDRDWPWPEQVLTYENALLPRALIAAGARTGDAELGRKGLHVLDWLIRVQTTIGGSFSAVGSDGWWPRGGARSRFDQQPIEATSMILAAEAAFDETGEARYVRIREAAYAWFLGDNDMDVPLADPGRGACHDGLTPRGANLNEGAESTLMWLTALEHVRAMRATAGGEGGPTRPSLAAPVLAGAPS